MPNSIESIKYLEHIRVMAQNQRIAMSNRVSATDRGASEVDPELMRVYQAEFESIEKKAASDIADLVKDHLMWDWFERVKGIGPGLAGCLVAHVDIHKAHTVSALWRYAGQGVGSDGQRDRLQKGQKAVFNKELKRICYLIGSSFLRSSSPYVDVYEEKRTLYERERKDWTLAHQNNAAQRAMVKLFLSHFWEEWRTREGLPVRPVYAIQHLNHDGYRAADSFLKPLKVKGKRGRKKKVAAEA